MPRHIRATAKQVQKSRQDWYILHYDNRNQIKALSPDKLQTYLQAASYIEPPIMTVFGGLTADYPERKAYSLATHYGLDVNLINPWYLTEQGWSDFQALWAQLPEPVDIYAETVHSPCVQIGELYTLSTMPAEAEAIRRA